MRTTTDRRPALLSALALAAAGCGGPPGDAPARFPTRGTVSYNGQPVKGAIVTFHPLPLDRNDWRTVRPQCVTAADGSFQPSSLGQQDGAMAGEYAVTVMWTGENAGDSPDRFQGRHADPKKPVLKVTVTAGENVLPPIELKGPPINPKAGGKGDL